MSQQSYDMPYQLLPVFNTDNELVAFRKALDVNADGSVKWRQLRFAGPVDGPDNSVLLDRAWLSLSIGGRSGQAVIWPICLDADGNPYQPDMTVTSLGTLKSGEVFTVTMDKRFFVQLPPNMDSVSVAFNTGHIDYPMGVGFEIEPKGFSS